MKRWIWASLAIPIAGLALVLALVQSGHMGTRHSSAAENPQMAIDVVKDGSTWCNPIDDATSVDIDDVHEVAICYTPADDGSTNAASDFNIQVYFDDSLDSCSSTGQTGTGLNANPDFIGDITNPSATWDCSGGGLNYPRCGTDATGAAAGEAFITCGNVNDPGTLTGSWPMAVITMTASGNGLDSLSFGTVALYDYNGENLIRCPDAVNCLGATIQKGPTPEAPTNTPTETPTPTDTATPTDTPTATATPTDTPLPTPYADIDKIEDTGWCDTVDAESEEVVGDSHSLAVCAHNMPDPIAGFDLAITYDDELDGCTEINCTDGTCVDDNPELAAALGAGWDCDIEGQPVCDQQPTGPLASAGSGHAFISCSGTGSIQSGPLAILNLDVLAAGIDNVAIDSLVVYDDAGAPMGECGIVDGGPTMPCDGATDTKVEPSPTPSPTNTATATSTPTATATPTNTPPPSATPTFTPTPTIWAYIDKNLNNGDGPCDIVDSTSTETVGQDHTLAVCLGNVPAELDEFYLAVSYDATLDTCTPLECTDDYCLDANPDANAGDTTFGMSLGAGWDCDVEGEPWCGTRAENSLAVPADGNTGIAYLLCQREEDGILTTAIDGGFIDYIALAAITFHVSAAGTDHVNIEELYVGGLGFAASCGAVFADVNADSIIEQGMPCQGATDTKQSNIRHRTPTPKPTETGTPTVPPPPSATPLPPPTATPTPLGGVGTQLVPPETGSGSSGGGVPWALALLTGVAGATVLAGGLYLRFARKRIR